MRKTVIVSGYATVDYPVRLPLPLYGHQTATVEALCGGRRWPRAGGAALYVSRRIAAAGHRAQALVTLGHDGNGALYLDACRAANICTATIARTVHVRTPWCMLLYHDDGHCTCLLDRGEVDQQALTDSTIRLLTAADFVCVAAGSAQVSATLLTVVPDHIPFAWIAKHDETAFPTWLTAGLARRADLIFCNAAERPMVDAARSTGARPDQSIIETRGADGVLLERGGDRLEIPCEAIRVRDATGAGDTLAGEVLATLLCGNADLPTAIRRGIEATRVLLLSRAD